MTNERPAFSSLAFGRVPGALNPNRKGGSRASSACAAETQSGSAKLNTSLPAEIATYWTPSTA